MMRSRSRAGSDTEEPSEDSMLESELAKLQRSYRVMTNDYRAYKEETKRIINKQDMLIEQLGMERQELDTMLSKMETTQNKNMDDYNARALSELSRNEKDNQELIKQEKDKIEQLDEQITNVDKKIADQRKQMGGVHSSTAKHIALQKKKAVLENRLDKSVTLFNRQLAINQDLRDDIDHFRRERSVFENLYKRLSRELELTKKETSEVIATSTQAFEQRDEAQSKMLALKDRSEKDQQQHDAEMKDLMRTINHDNRIKEFMNIKASDRSEYKVEEAAKRKRDEKGMDADRATIRSYEEAFRKIQEVTGKSDIEVIINDFIRKEKENFALFNYVNELNSEVESLMEDLQRIKDDITHFNQENQQIEQQRKHIMKDLENQHQQAGDETDRADMRLNEVNKALDQLRSGIDGLFTRIGCDPRPIREMLGGEAGISNKNIMIYLGQIEHKTTELLHILHYIRLKKSQLEGGLPAKVEPSLNTSHQQAVVKVLPPAAVDDPVGVHVDSDQDEDEEEMRPLSQAELRERITHDLDRRHAQLQAVIHRQKSHISSRDSKKKKQKGGGSSKPDM